MNRILGALILILGIVLYLTPIRLFPICGFPLQPGAEVGLLATMACYQTLRAAQLLAGVAVLLGLMPLLRPQPRLTLICSMAAAGLGILVILTPLVIAPVCRFPNMPCRIGTRPALVTLGLLMLAAGGIGMMMRWKADARRSGR